MDFPPSDSGIHRLFRLLIGRLACASSETSFSEPATGVGHVESEPLRHRRVTPVHQDCGRAERAAFMEYCPYEISESLGGDAIAIHQREALSVNVSKGGMLLLMDQRPPVQQVFEIQLPASTKGDRKSTRLNSSHGYISYAVFCLKKKKKKNKRKYIRSSLKKE